VNGFMRYRVFLATLSWHEPPAGAQLVHAAHDLNVLQRGARVLLPKTGIG
jgi:hypothetical protein